MWRSTGPARCRTTAPMRADRRTSFPAPRMSRACHVRQSAPGRRLDGAARRDRALRRRDRQLHAALLLAGRGAAARPAHRHDGLAEGETARHHRGRRRRVRVEDRRAIRNIRPARRREAHRPAGRLDGDALGGVSLAISRRATPSPRPSLRIDEKGKFLALRVKHIAAMGAFIGVARRAHPDQQFLALLSRHVRDPAHPGRRAMRVHQHGADRALSRRRAAGGELRAGAAGGRGRARDRHRPDPAAAAQSHSAQVDAVQDRGRNDL